MDWAVAANELLNDPLSRSRLASAPLVAGNSLYISVRSANSPSPAKLICCGLDGEVRWKAAVPLDSVVPLGETGDSLAIQGDSIIWNLAGNEVIAVDAEQGIVRWKSPLGEKTSDRSSTSGSSALMVQQGLVLVTGVAGLVALDSQTGAFRWRCPLKDPVSQILGVSENILVVSGISLCGIDLKSGQVLWQTGGSEPAIEGFGRGILLEETVLWPTVTELWTVDAKSGRVQQRAAIEQIAGCGGGNLTLSGGTLVIAGDESVTAFRVRVAGSVSP
ncbi:PQQ-binding-like beta-propeller repeat protein [Planctomicrobium sp. SH661]|uniref:outer membrane protein assembly factor BamB family protein n=1 Tax=Planctomicrobium sp. SH661 TaxID=3448124 RepID=UPI003F5CA52B